MGVSARLNRHLQSFGVWSATRSCRQIVNFLVVNFCDHIEYMALAFTRDDVGATVSIVSKNRNACRVNIIHLFVHSPNYWLPQRTDKSDQPSN